MNSFTIYLRPTNEFIKEKWSNRVKALNGFYGKKPKKYRGVQLPFNEDSVKLANELITRFGFKKTEIIFDDLQAIIVEKVLFEPFTEALKLYEITCSKGV